VNVSFNPLAEQELNDAARYYELESTGLGDSFLAEAQRCCERIVEHPEAGRIDIGSIRRRLLRRFPYAILYSIRPGTIRVLAVMNLRRRPAYWVGRS
jgi:plasmid stabilization system protein ParE